MKRFVKIGFPTLVLTVACVYYLFGKYAAKPNFLFNGDREKFSVKEISDCQNVNYFFVFVRS